MIKLQVPATWSDVTLEQLRIIAETTDLMLTREEMLTTLFCRFSGLRIAHEKNNVTFLKGKERFKLKPWQLSYFAKRLAFVLDEMPNDIVNPTPVNGHLFDITFGNYFHADALMYGYRLEGKPDMVRKALGDLGDHRRGVSKQFANEVMLWWTGVQQWLKSQYPAVFEDGGASTEAYDPLKARQNIMLMLNNNSPQDNERIEQSKMHDVLSALQSKIEYAKQLEEQMKKHGKQ